MSKHCPNIERMSALARHHFREVTKMVCGCLVVSKLCLPLQCR
nr:MAG TPA: hypothetical protein [Caudoviricetes sp.]